MRRVTQRALAAGIAAMAAVGAACGATATTTSTTPTATTPTTETFSGTLSANNAHTYPFISAAGTISLTLTSVAPDGTVALGISLGTWSGTTCTVGTGLFNDTATAPTTLTGQATTVASLCARVYDSAGQLAAPTTYVITVVHQ